ncbi:MAG: acetate--CoA ligase family protein [Candidatus Obscuribacterales bacterium]|nr:acetate--CoA ligase family protein [Candidatus Obscuribacterales bacterium]HNB21268.1 acetate--CoA ligase family protein [Candidatus Melainabacteria bacterium]
MNLYEWEAKKIFQEHGIPVPPSHRITKPEELRKVHLGYPLTLKVQVQSGGRGKAGGIQFAQDLKDGEAKAKDLLKMVINGSKTESLLIEPRLKIAREIYLSVTLDRSRGCAIFIASAEGGIEIESSTNVVTMPIPYPYHDYVGRDLAKQIGLTGTLLNKFADLANKLYRLFESKDLELAEINPLIVTDGDEVLALDGKITICDDALGRHKCFAGWQETHMLDLSEREKRSKRAGLNLVELDGNIGILCNGAGLTMATMDLVKAFGGQPGNFLDAGGGSDTEKTLEALEIVHDNPKCDVILVNILGGITACDEVAQALVAFMKRHPERKLIVRLRGNNQDVAEKMLAESGLKLYPELEAAVKQAVEQSKVPAGAGR